MCIFLIMYVSYQSCEGDPHSIFACVNHPWPNHLHTTIVRQCNKSDLMGCHETLTLYSEDHPIADIMIIDEAALCMHLIPEKHILLS